MRIVFISAKAAVERNRVNRFANPLVDLDKI